MGIFSLLSIHPSKPPPLVAVNGPKAQILVPSGSQFAFFPPDHRGRPQNERGYGPYPSHHRRPREPSPGYSEFSDFPPVFERQGRRRRGPGLRGGDGRPYTPPPRGGTPSEEDIDGMNGMGMRVMGGRGRAGGFGEGIGRDRFGAISAPAAYDMYPGMTGMGGMYPGPVANMGGMAPGMGDMGPAMGPAMGGGGIGMNPGMPPAYGAAPGPGLVGAGGNPYAQYAQPAGVPMPEQAQLYPKAANQAPKRRVAHIPGGIQAGGSGKHSHSKPTPKGQGGCKCGADSDAPKLDSLDACICSKKCSCKGGIRAHYFDQGENGESIKGQIRYVLSEDMGRNCGDHANCYTADGKRKGKLGVEEQCEVSRNETKGGLKMLRKELADMNERLGRMAMGSSSSPRPQTPRPYPGMGMPQDSMMGRPQIGPSGMPMGMRPSYPPQAFGDMDVEIGPYDPSHSMMEPMMMGGQGIPHGMKMGSRRKRGGGRPPGMGGFGRPPLMGTGMPTRGERATGRGPGRRRRPEFADDDMDMRRGAFGDMGMDEDDDWEDLGDDTDDFDDDRPARPHASPGGGRRGGRPGGRGGRGRQAHVEDEEDE